MGSIFNRIERVVLGKKRIVERKLLTIAPHFVWRELPFFRNAYAKFGGKIAGIPEMRCFFLQSAIRSVHKVEGHVAECGTRNGKSALYMLEACEQDRRFFLFDSFDGLSDPVKGKDSLKTSFKDGERLFKTDFTKVQERFTRYPNVSIMKGWIPDRYAEVKNEKFCFVHIDVDLYQPTLDSLLFFYPKLSIGGIIICDDYGSGNYPGARRALDEFFADKPETPAELPQGQAFIVKLG